MDFSGLSTLVFAAAAAAIPVLGISDVLRQPPGAFEAAGRSRRMWIALQIFVPLFGSLSYYAFVRPRVRAQHYFDGE